jgi:hypothetical protein
VSAGWKRRLRDRVPAAAIVAGTVLALAVTACGGSSQVSAATYVKSICTSLGGWKQHVQSAGQTLQASGIATASPANAKKQYVHFVSTLLTATRNTTGSLKAAGTPAVKDGGAIASGLSSAFERGSQGLATALSHASAIPTTSASAFGSAATGVTTEIRSALQNIAAITPRSSPQLRTAALKEPSCRSLAG